MCARNVRAKFLCRGASTDGMVRVAVRRKCGANYKNGGISAPNAPIEPGLLQSIRLDCAQRVVHLASYRNGRAVRCPQFCGSSGDIVEGCAALAAAEREKRARVAEAAEARRQKKIPMKKQKLLGSGSLYYRTARHAVYIYIKTLFVVRDLVRSFFSVSAQVCDWRNWNSRSNSFVRAPPSGGDSNRPSPCRVRSAHRR